MFSSRSESSSYLRTKNQEVATEKREGVVRLMLDGLDNSYSRQGRSGVLLLDTKTKISQQKTERGLCV